MGSPRILVTLSNPARAADPAAAATKNRLYLDAIARHGGRPVALDDRAMDDERNTALKQMDGLLITGGADLDPALYGEAPQGAHPPDHGRDALDADALTEAQDRGIPVLGICRGLQAINVLSGGSLLQHVEDHESPPYPERAAEATRHPMRVVPGTRLHRLVDHAVTIEVNSFHHQAVHVNRLAPGLHASGLVRHGEHDLVEALEADEGRWLMAVQCHPERRDSSPTELDRLWEAFVEAAGSA
jgi:putative glutamine amidotransferase